MLNLDYATPTFTDAQEASPWFVDHDLSNQLGFESTKEHWTRALRSLRALWELPSGWDGDEASAPDPDCIEAAYLLLQKLRRNHAAAPSRILPVHEGGILIEWFELDTYVEAEIVNPTLIEWMYKSKDKPAFHKKQLLPQLESYSDSDPYWVEAA